MPQRTKPKRATAAHSTPVRADSERALTAGSLLLAGAAFIAPLLAGIPEERGWTDLACAMIFAAAVVLFGALGAQASETRRLKRMVAAGSAGIVAVSCLWFAVRWLLVEHATAKYLDVMLHAVGYWAALACLAAVGATIARRSRAHAYALMLVIVATAALCSGIGLQHYLIEVRNHVKDWREFGTSTPDYFAGYLLITIPVTLALFLGAPAGEGKRLGWLLALALVLQIAVLPTTGSRFALVSLLALFVFFGAAIAWALKRGLELGPALKMRLIVLAVLIAAGAAVFGGPVAHRLKSGTLASQANSGDFRLYTWEGALRLARRDLFLGAGPGMFVYEYPKVAVVGFTRVAHSGYLQVLDDLGIPGLAAVLATLFGAVAAVLAGMGRGIPAETTAEPSALLSQVAPNRGDDRIAAIGLAAGVFGALVQNLIDTDWSMTLCGVTMFLAAGIATGLSAKRSGATAPAPACTPSRTVQIGLAAAAGIFCIVCLVWAAAGLLYESGNLISAAQIEPLNAEYVGAVGWKIDVPAGDAPAAQANLHRAVALAPDSSGYFRLASLYAQTGRVPQALAYAQRGLSYDPSDLEMLLLSAQLSGEMGRSAESLEYYRRMADLQVGPYGRFPAIGEIVDYHYAFADYTLGAALLQQGRFADAAVYLARGQAVLQEYADEGGSLNLERLAETGVAGGARLDRRLQSLYMQTMPALIAAYHGAHSGPAEIAARNAERRYEAAYATLVAKSAAAV